MINPTVEVTKHHQKWQLPSDKLNQVMASLPDGQYRIVILSSANKRLRSINQNDYYWGVVLEILSEHLGYTPEECHELMKLEHHFKMVNVNGQEIKIPQSTASLDTVGMELYLARIRQWASFNLSVYIPLPNEIYQHD